MSRLTKYLVTLIPLGLAVLYGAFAITGGVYSVYDVVERWIFVGFVLTIIVLLADGADDLINRWHHRHH